MKPPFITQSRQNGYFKGATRKKRNSYLFEYHLEKCLAILADLDPSKKRKGDGGSGLYTEERGKLIRAQRIRAEFNQKIAEGQYVAAAAIEKESFSAARVLRDNLQNLPSKLSAIIAAKSKKKEKEIYQILRAEINRALVEIIDSLKKIQVGNE